jgi:sugar phosphate isomerase/epimerase
MRVKHLVAALLAMAAGAAVSCGAERVPKAQKFFAFCVELGVPGPKHYTFAEQAKLLRQLGYDGVGIPIDGHFADNLKALDEAGLPLLNVWTGVDVRPGATAYGANVAEAIRKLKGRPAVVNTLLHGLKPGDPQGLSPAITALRALGDVAAEAGVRIAVYHHTHDWTEHCDFTIELVRKVNHPQVGYQFNLCHWLMVEGQRDYRPLLRANPDKLFGVSISGATLGAKTWTDGLIRPLDEGNFDFRPLLATLDEIGYCAPVGQQCFGVRGDPRDYLARSIKVWRQLHPSAATGN